MRTLYPILLTMMLLFAFDASAQVDRRVGRSYAKPKKSEKVDYVQLTVEKLKEDLVLDNLQEAILKNLIVTHQSKMNTIFESDIPTSSKDPLYSAANEKLDQDIMAMLTPEQVEKYFAMKNKKKKEKKISK